MVSDSIRASSVAASSIRTVHAKLIRTQWLVRPIRGNAASQTIMALLLDYQKKGHEAHRGELFCRRGQIHRHMRLKTVAQTHRHLGFTQVAQGFGKDHSPAVNDDAFLLA